MIVMNGANMFALIIAIMSVSLFANMFYIKKLNLN